MTEVVHNVFFALGLGVWAGLIIISIHSNECRAIIQQICTNNGDTRTVQSLPRLHHFILQTADLSFNV